MGSRRLESITHEAAGFKTSCSGVVALVLNCLPAANSPSVCVCVAAVLWGNGIDFQFHGTVTTKKLLKTTLNLQSNDQNLTHPQSGHGTALIIAQRLKVPRYTQQLFFPNSSGTGSHD